MSWGEGKLEFPATEKFWRLVALNVCLCFLQNKKWTGGLYSPITCLPCISCDAHLLNVSSCVLDEEYEHLSTCFRSCTCKFFFLFCVWIWTGFQYCTKTWFLLFAFISLMDWKEGCNFFSPQSVQIASKVLFF